MVCLVLIFVCFLTLRTCLKSPTSTLILLGKGEGMIVKSKEKKEKDENDLSDLLSAMTVSSSIFILLVEVYSPNRVNSLASA